MRHAFVLAILFLSGCATESEDRAHQARLKQAYEIGRQWRQQYIATKRPVFRLKFRHQYPTMSEEEIEVLVDDALEEGLREAGEQDRQRGFQRLFPEPVTPPPVTISPPINPSVNCTSSKVGTYIYTNCD
jgi:hypothetical protein